MKTSELIVEIMNQFDEKAQLLEIVEQVPDVQVQEVQDSEPQQSVIHQPAAGPELAENESRASGTRATSSESNETTNWYLYVTAE